MVEESGGDLVTIDDVALRVAEALGAAGVPFMRVGGFSSNFHGIPRSTKDDPHDQERPLPCCPGRALRRKAPVLAGNRRGCPALACVVARPKPRRLL